MVGADNRMDVLHLFDKVRLQGVPSCGVHDPNVILLGRLKAVSGNIRCVWIALLAVEEDALLLTESLELIVGSCPEGIGAYDRRAKSLPLEVGGKLGSGGGLSRAL